MQEHVDRQLSPSDPPTYYFYVVTAWDGGSPRAANDEHSQIGWFSVDEMRTLPQLADRAYVEMAERALVFWSNSHNIA